MSKILRGMAVLGLLLAATLGLASPAAAQAPQRLATSDFGVESVDFCTWIQQNALCTNPTVRLNLRAQPNTSSTVVTVMDPDSMVWLHCWTAGQSINGDSVWYWVDDASEGYTVNPVYWPKGWAAGYYLATGPDPHPWVPHC